MIGLSPRQVRRASVVEGIGFRHIGERSGPELIKRLGRLTSSSTGAGRTLVKKSSLTNGEMISDRSAAAGSGEGVRLRPRT